MAKKFDKNEFKELIRKLGELGLSEKESRVYISLLPTPQSGTGAIIKNTGLHGQFVYLALARLEELGLVKHSIQNGRKKFTANPPDRLVLLIEEKRRSADLVAAQLSSLLSPTQPQDFEVFQGRSAFVKNEFRLLNAQPSGSTIDILSAGGDQYVSLLGIDANEYEKKRLQNKVKIRFLSTSGNQNYLKIMAQTRDLFEYRVLPEAAAGVDTAILDEELIFHLFGDPVVTFAFKNKAIADGCRRFFEVLWNLSSR